MQIQWSVAEEILSDSEWLKCPSWSHTDEWDLHHFNSDQNQENVGYTLVGVTGLDGIPGSDNRRRRLGYSL